VKDHDRGLRRRVGNYAGDLIDEVSLHDRRRIDPGQFDRGSQSPPSVVVIGEDAALQPPHRLTVTHVDGLTIDPPSPDDLWNSLGQGYIVTESARDQDRGVCIPQDLAVVVVVGEPIQQQVQSGARADLDESEWLRKRRERREQSGAPSDLIRLRVALANQLEDIVPTIEQ
jgi:hypothetical protein